MFRCRKKLTLSLSVTFSSNTWRNLICGLSKIFRYSLNRSRIQGLKVFNPGAFTCADEGSKGDQVGRHRQPQNAAAFPIPLSSSIWENNMQILRPCPTISSNPKQCLLGQHADLLCFRQAVLQSHGTASYHERVQSKISNPSWTARNCKQKRSFPATRKVGIEHKHNPCDIA